MTVGKDRLLCGDGTNLVAEASGGLDKVLRKLKVSSKGAGSLKEICYNKDGANDNSDGDALRFTQWTWEMVLEGQRQVGGWMAALTAI